ncbi:MAG: hypothetical protein KDA90_20610 [Planctomycetaceae bacterium]|nr:hypothetical protein [Planctomycetaceae bacterium]
MAEEITRFVQYLSRVTGHPAVPVRFDAFDPKDKTCTADSAARSEIRAYCDGHAIHLPPYLAVAGAHLVPSADASAGHASARELNAVFLAYYLTLHEFLHLALGSWNFNFKSKRGKLIFRKLRPRRRNLQSRGLECVSSTILDKLRQEGIRLEAVDIRTKPDLATLWLHFPNPQLAQWLFNAIEDGRIESTIARRWPGLWHIHRIIQVMYADEVCPTAKGTSPIQSLINAIGMYAAERVLRVEMRREQAEVFGKAQKILTRLRDLPRRSVYDSIAATIRIYSLLENELSENLQSFELGAFRPVLDAEEIALRLELSKKSDDPSVYESEDAGGNSNYEVTHPGVWLPEWNGVESQEHTTHVSLHRLTPTPIASPQTQLMAAFPPLPLDRRTSLSGGRRRWHHDGQHLETERLPSIIPYLQLGYLPPPINFDSISERVPIKVTLLIDLSISMEAPRYCLGGETPISRATQAATWMARHLEALGVELAAYGAVDGGSRLCQLYEVPQPVSRFLPSVRCIGQGGFRLGAFIRAISQSPAELGMTPFHGRHILLVFTDTDHGYLSFKDESVFERLQNSNCPTCTTRHRCRVEMAAGAINARVNTNIRIFAPVAYELGDIDDAAATSSVEVAINYFGPTLPYAGARESAVQVFRCNSPDVWPEVLRAVFTNSSGIFT